MLARIAIAPLSLVAIAGASSPAQTPVVGAVGEIMAIGARQGCPGRSSGTAPLAVHIRRDGANTVVSKGQRERVLLGDEYRVQRLIDVRLSITSAALGQGAFILAPQLLCPLRDVDTTVTPYAVVDSGSYAITRSRDGLLQLGVLSGGAFIQWNSKDRRLLVVAGGHVAHVTGTEFAVLSAPAGDAALIYVREGVVSFPEVAGNIQVRAGQLFALRRGVVPRELAASRAQLIRLADQDVGVHLSALDRAVAVPANSAPGKSAGRSMWSNPLTYIVAAGVVGGGAYCLASDTKCGLKKREGRGTRVVVQIPL